MREFYGSKRCVIENVLSQVDWSHIQDMALEPSNKRVSQYLIVSCATMLKMRLLAYNNAYVQPALEPIPPTCR